MKKILNLQQLCSDHEWTISDGYHTFDELYDHRIALFLALCRQYASGVRYPVWRSRQHHDGSGYDGWFVMGIGRRLGEQITYHLPLHLWDATAFAETLDRAPEWDGHTSVDVVERINAL